MQTYPGQMYPLSQSYLVCSCHATPREQTNPPGNTHHGSTTGKWCKSPMQNLYKHYALLFSDSPQLCIYMTSPCILAPNVWKCYQDYFQSTPIHSYPSTSSLSVLLDQGTTFKELLSLIFYRKRAELHRVTLTFTFMHQVGLTFDDADIHSAECNWEGSGHEMWPLEHWEIYVDWCVLFLILLLLLLNVVILVVHLWMWINNYSWTRTTTTLHSNNNMNLNKKISQFIYMMYLLLLLLLLGNFVLVHM